VIGTCKLCLTANVDLQNSHLIPAGAYKLIHSSDGSSPIVMKSAVTIKKDEQITDYVLCGECEQRFNDNGERWVLAYCNQFGAGFRLNDLLDQAQPLEVVGDAAIYAGSAIPEIDMEKLAYFAASVLWRGSVHDWRSGKDAVRSPKLGPYEEDFRKYLMGHGPFPPNVFFGVDIVGDKNLWPSVFVPYGGRREDLMWQYVFPFLGIVFLFLLGKSVDPARFRYCAYRSPERLITRGSMKNDTFINDVGKLMIKSHVVGKLKKMGK
jgi:hypothetical protein